MEPFKNHLEFLKIKYLQSLNKYRDEEFLTDQHIDNQYRTKNQMVNKIKTFQESLKRIN
jgi:hypothetical protein